MELCCQTLRQARSAGSAKRVECLPYRGSRALKQYSDQGVIRRLRTNHGSIDMSRGLGLTTAGSAWIPRRMDEIKHIYSPYSNYASALDNPAPFDEELSANSVCGVVLRAAVISQNVIFDY